MISNRFSFVIMFLFATVTIGSAQTIPDNESYYSPPPIERNYFFAKVGLNAPVGQFAQTPSPDRPLLDPFIGEDGMGGKTGFTMAAGYRFSWFEEESYENTLYPTCAVSGSFKYNSIRKWEDDLSWDANQDGNEYIFNSGAMNGLFIDFSAGLAYNIKNDAVIELNGYLGLPVRLGFPSISNEVYGGQNENDKFGVHYFSVIPEGDKEMKLSRGIEILIRTNQFSFGLEYFTCHIRKRYLYDRYVYFDQDYPYYGNIRTIDDREYQINSFIADFKWKTFQITASYVF